MAAPSNYVSVRHFFAIDLCNGLSTRIAIITCNVYKYARYFLPVCAPLPLHCTASLLSGAISFSFSVGTAFAEDKAMAIQRRLDLACAGVFATRALVPLVMVFAVVIFIAALAR